MDNAKLVANLLLAAVAMSTAHHQATTTGHSANLSTFITTEGSRRTLTRTAKKRVVTKARPLTYTVTATAYQAVAGQTDDEPFVTADNSLIKPRYSSKTRWMALSNDLLARWGGQFQYGDRVRVSGISPQLVGIYTVHDTMNKRHRHCIDILTHVSEKVDIFTPGVKIQLVSTGRAIAAAAARRQGQLPIATRRSARSAGNLLASRALRRTLLASDKRGNYFASAIL